MIDIIIAVTRIIYSTIAVVIIIIIIIWMGILLILGRSFLFLHLQVSSLI